MRLLMTARSLSRLRSIQILFVRRSTMVIALRSGMGDVPLFNIGTEQLDTQRWQAIIDQWVERLGRISLPGIEVRAAINEVFYGRGYQTTFAGKRCQNTLVLPTELKKVFMDELSGEPRSDVLEILHAEFEQAISDHVLSRSEQ